MFVVTLPGTPDGKLQMNTLNDEPIGILDFETFDRM